MMMNAECVIIIIIIRNDAFTISPQQFRNGNAKIQYKHKQKDTQTDNLNDQGLNQQLQW